MIQTLTTCWLADVWLVVYFPTVNPICPGKSLTKNEVSDNIYLDRGVRESNARTLCGNSDPVLIVLSGRVRIRFPWLRDLRIAHGSRFRDCPWLPDLGIAHGSGISDCQLTPVGHFSFLTPMGSP